ncbi:MAG: PAS domain-containing protein [Thermoleophilia bacterium]|nr:PAS domain-containing protein [Thermoleophilia bacterium]
MPAFICPRCARRERASDRHDGHQARGCAKCGFGFMFELLEDYYAGPNTALVVCDQNRRIIAAGHAATAVTGYQERDLIGHEVVSRLGMGNFPNADPAATALEWGVRQLDVACTFRPAGLTKDQPAVADFFPAYDDDGGLLVALTPRTGAQAPA